MAAEDAEHAGMPSDEARRTARRRFGNPLALRELAAEADSVAALDEIGRDLRHALRQLKRSPVFAATAVITLALGIGATTAIFTLVHQVMLRSLPVARPDQLWRLGDADLCCYRTGYHQNDWNYFSWQAYGYFRANTPAFVDLAALQVGNTGLGIRRYGSSAPVTTGNGQYVSGNFFRTLGISPWRGRLFTDADDQEAAPPVAVMSFHTWQGEYASDPSVVGAVYQINGHPVTMIGVTPPGFFGAKVADRDMPDFWLPLAEEPLIAGGTSRLTSFGVAWLDLIGRVHPGTDPNSLQAQLRVELQQWLGSHVADMMPGESEGLEKQTVRLTPGGGGVSLMRERYQNALKLLSLAAICVLLVACANIGNLLLARGLRNRQQTALRAALGASRARLARQTLIESLALGLCGCLTGIAVAYAGARVILHLAFTGAWVPVNAAPSTPVLLFALGASLVTAVLFGVMPAWMTAHADPIDALRGGNRTVGNARSAFGTGRAQKALVAVQVAVSLVLLSSAAMLGQSLRNLEHENLGFNTNGRYLVSINPLLSNYRQEQLVPLFRAVEERLRAIPGVRGTGPTLWAPMSGTNWDNNMRIEGEPEPSATENVSSLWTRVTPGFFETLGDRIAMGRPFTDADNADTRPVAVINQAFAKRFFGHENPIGRHFGPAPGKNAGMYEIVGVASDIDYVSEDLGHPAGPMYFLPEAQATHFEDAGLEGREVRSHYFYNIVIWAPGNPRDLDAPVRKVLAEVDPNLVMYDVQPYSEVIHADFAQQNMISALTSLFGAVGLLLAAVGLYGVTAYGVEQRTSEIGVRMALGADRLSVVALVLHGAFRQVSVGLALGIPAAFCSGYLMSGQLFGVSPWSPLMLSAAAVMLGLAALIAATVPACSAARVDPVQAMKTE